MSPTYDFTGARELKALEQRVRRLYGKDHINLVQHNCAMRYISIIQLALQDENFAKETLDHAPKNTRRTTQEA